MKTPMQELIEQLNNVKPQDFCSIETIKGWAESMLEKEKEYFMAYGFSCCLMTKQKKAWSLEALFNEHFNKEER